ncbi:acyltransferase family protein [Methylibium sp.]|uniref:acyltransferase family protein n=1 Tax=Methylibium sp. TaxID=2067992 RepID=UPI003D11B8F9
MYASVQTARSIAILLVVLFHCSAVFALPKYFGIDPLRGCASFGYAGVDLFFVISGFVIAHAHASDFGQPARAPSYAIKRVLRIYPIYWLVLACVATALVATHAFGSAMPLDAATLVKTVALLPQDPNHVGGTGAPLLIVAWTLQHEVFFYLVVLLFIVSRHLGAVTLMLISGYGLSHPQDHLAAFMLDPLNLEFLMGFAVWHLARSAIRPVACTLLTTGGVIGFVVVAVLDVGGTGLGGTPCELGYGVSSAVGLLGAIAMERQGWRPASRIFDEVGAASYSIYLIHLPLISVICKLLSKARTPDPALRGLLYCVVFLGATCCAIAFYRYVEAPLLAFLRSRLTTSNDRSTAWLRGAGVRAS